MAVGNISLADSPKVLLRWQRHLDQLRVRGDHWAISLRLPNEAIDQIRPPPPLTVVFHFPPKMCLKKRKMWFQRNRMSSGENEEVSNKPFSAISLAMMTTSFNQLPFFLSLLAASSNHLQRCASNQLWLDFFNATMSKCERAFPCNSRLPTILLTTLSHTWVF